MNARCGFLPVAAVALIAACAVPAVASPLVGSMGGGSGYSPAVPVSALARPAAWFDPGRLSISTSVAVGSGFSGGTTQGLQTTSLTYRFDKPVWMRVSVGNSWGSPASADGKMFLEGLDFGFRPTPSMYFNIQYRDLRSPLQYSQPHMFGYGDRGW
jgi:hypothetical protein